jgi:rhodanese-related sulfurtransferase
VSVPTEVSAHDAEAALSDGGEAVLLDVREAWEWEEAHVPGAVHIPMNEVPARLEEIPADRDLYVICKVGGRSARVVDYLRRHGRERAANVSGGLDAWMEAGLPVE